MTRPITIGVEASALSARRTGIGNYLVNLLTVLPEVAGPMTIKLYSNNPMNVTGLGNVTPRVARPLGRRGFLWQNTQLAMDLLSDPPDLFWGASGLIPVVRPRRMPTLVTVHDLVYRFAGETLPLVNRWSRSLLQPASVKAASRVIAVSQATADDVEHIYGRQVDQVVHPIVHGDYRAVTEEETARVRATYDLPRDYLLTLGTLEPRKNLIELVRAALLLQRTGISAPLLVIAGGAGWLDGELTAAISSGEAAGVVRRLGFVTDRDMPGLYAGAAYFVIASVYEGFGMPVVEAQLCGVRVLASDIRSLREASGGYAAFFKPTAEGIATCISQVIAGAIEVPVRPAKTIENDPRRAAERVWAVMESCL